MNVIDRILSRLDIDPRQWRALVGMPFKLLKRRKSAFSSNDRSSANNLWVGLFIYGVMGIMFANMIATVKTAGVASFFVLNFILIFIAMSILLEFGVAIVYPEDISVLGHRPISSRTYFASKMAIVIAAILLYATLLGGPSVVTFLVKFGIAPAFALFFAIISGSLSTGMLMIIIYTVLVRYTKPEKVQNIMGYTQLLFSFIFYGGYIMLPGKAHEFFAAATPGAWTIILPTSWFASIVSLVSGEWTMVNVTGCSLSIFMFMGIFYLIGGRISLTYSDTIAKAAIPIASLALAAKRRRFDFHFFRRAEDRAIAMLIIRQFRYDVKFKMAILSILPLIVLYLYQGLQGGKGICDPFLVNITMEKFGASTLLYLAVILFPALLKKEITQNDIYQASWVLFASPVDRGNVMLSVYRMLIRAFVLPYIIIIALIFLWFYKNPLHVFMHVMVLFLFCDIFLLILFFIKPALPFSLPREIGDRITAFMITISVGSIFFLALMAMFAKLLYPALWTYLTGVAVLLSISLLLRYLLEKRLKKVGEQLEFQG